MNKYFWRLSWDSSSFTRSRREEIWSCSLSFEFFLMISLSLATSSSNTTTLDLDWFKKCASTLTYKPPPLEKQASGDPAPPATCGRTLSLVLLAADLLVSQVWKYNALFSQVHLWINMWNYLQFVFYRKLVFYRLTSPHQCLVWPSLHFYAHLHISSSTSQVGNSASKLRINSANWEI